MQRLSNPEAVWKPAVKWFAAMALALGFFMSVPAHADHTTGMCMTTQGAYDNFNNIPGVDIYAPDREFQLFINELLSRKFQNWIIRPNEYDEMLVAFVTDGVPFMLRNGPVDVLVYHYKEGCLVTNRIGYISTSTWETLQKRWDRVLGQRV